MWILNKLTRLSWGGVEKITGCIEMKNIVAKIKSI